jgi:hypothetical protein
LYELEKSLTITTATLLAQYVPQDKTWLYLNLNDLHVVDSPHSDRGFQMIPLVGSGGKRRITVLEAVTTIQNAAMDSRVHGMIISFNESTIESRAWMTGGDSESNVGMGVLCELQEAIATFRHIKELQRVQRLLQQGVKEEDIVRDQEIPILSREESLDRIPTDCTVVAVSDNYCTRLLTRLIVASGMAYSLATLANRIYMQPAGTLNLTGMSMQQFVAP